jgi:hypothetical protein
MYCVKVANRMECQKCGYPFSEARWPELDIPCNATQSGYDDAVAPHISKWREMNGEFQQVEMDGVREHCEHDPVAIGVKEISKWNQEKWKDDILGQRVVIWASNEGGYNSTSVDLCELLKWLSDKYQTDSIFRLITLFSTYNTCE